MKKKKERLENEFSSEEMESWAQEVRTAMKESPDENEEAFPNNAEELRDYILTLEENMKHKPTDHLREELRVYKAYQTGWYKGVCFTYEYFIDLKEQERSDEIKSKATIIDGKPMTDEQLENLKKSLSDDPNTPKGHWVGEEYYFDKETPELTEEELIEAGIDPSRYMTKKKKNI